MQFEIMGVPEKCGSIFFKLKLKHKENTWGKEKKLKENNNCFSSYLVSKIDSYLTHVETIPVILRDLLLCICSNDQLFVIHLGCNTCFLD